MHLLILGGTLFLGRHLVDAARQRGHRVSLFNRGRQNAELFPELEKLRGDRDGDLSALKGRVFDAVIDPSGFRAEQMQAVAAALGDAVPHYTFISSISVYDAFPPGRSYDERATVADGDAHYGQQKARAEEAIEAALPGRVAHVRAGLIVGPHDLTDRFTYWPRRIAQGGVVLAPGRPQRPVQWIDARDLADWCIQLAEQRITGTFNAAGPAQPASMGHLLERCRAVANSDARLVWVDDKTLLDNGVRPWDELPLWIPEDDPQAGGMMLADCRRALAAGLSLRPIDDTIAATLAWDRAEPEPRIAPAKRAKTMSLERELQLLDKIAPETRLPR